jgi:cell division protein ZapE
MKKKEFHYIDFMSLIHSKLDELKGRKNPLESVVVYLDRNYEVIFIDEFQVEDVADAMILANIIRMLIKRNIYLYLSSNAHPDDLYKNGLQRRKFIEAMQFMQTKFLIHKLVGQNDYRLINIFRKNSVNTTTESNKAISNLISKNFSQGIEPNKDLQINGRSFTCSDHGKEFVWLSFNKFFSQPTAANDYKIMCTRFKWIFINDFELVDDSRLDIVRRFISFIDIAYANKIKIKFFFEKITPENIYTGDKLDLLWGRCASRLQEMQTSEYLNSKKN